MSEITISLHSCGLVCHLCKMALAMYHPPSKTALSWFLLVNVYKLLYMKRLLTVDYGWCLHWLRELYYSLVLLCDV